MGKPRRKAVLDAAQEVAMPILVSTITTIVVFFPVLFLFGVARNLFLPLALTIAFALIMSFFVSRTVTPLLCLYVMKVLPHGAGAQAATAGARGARAVPHPALDRGPGQRLRRPPRAQPPPSVVGDWRHPGGVRGLARSAQGHRHRVLSGNRREPVQHLLQDADRHPRGEDGGDGQGHRSA